RRPTAKPPAKSPQPEELPRVPRRSNDRTETAVPTPAAEFPPPGLLPPAPRSTRRPPPAVYPPAPRHVPYRRQPQRRRLARRQSRIRHPAPERPVGAAAVPGAGRDRLGRVV